MEIVNISLFNKETLETTLIQEWNCMFEIVHIVKIINRN